MEEQSEAPNPTPSSPNPKRQKMSSTTTASSSDEEEKDQNTPTTLPRKPKYKRRKIAIFFAYCGVGYQGMQKNPGAKTIEADLEEALFLSGAVPEPDRGQPRRFDFARSARTDKGVSAVGQVVSGRFYVDPPGFVERLNSNLAPQIRVFGFKRATASFNAKKFCDKRRYVYLIPVFALDPTCHRDRESVMASVSSGSELVKCVECSERGRKVYGVMGRRSRDGKVVLLNGESALAGEKEIKEEKSVLVESGISSNMFVKTKIDIGSADNADVASSERGAVLENGTEGNADVANSGNGAMLENVAAESEKGEVNRGANLEKKSEFRYGEEEEERFNRILKYYEGTHNFHNFTTRMKAEDPAAKRYILSFNANATVNVDGIEFVKCEVLGQSFMLHQIRKMIGLAVAIMRNLAPESLIETAFEQKVNINVPMAPEVGLYLDECFFSSYNKRWQDTHEELSLKDYAQEAEEFKMKYIYSHIASTEHKDGVVALWLHSLNYRNYPDLRAADNVTSSEVNEDKAVADGPTDDFTE